MILAVVRHAESVENADKYNGFYQNPRPYSGRAAHDVSRNVVGLTSRGFRQSQWLGKSIDGLILDPRVGVHITVLAAARRFGADIAVMTTTQKAAINVAAHGQHFRDHNECRLLYALHGHVPYQQATDLRDTYELYGASTTAKRLFESWFLPLYALKQKSGVRAEQLPALFKYFRKALLSRPAEPNQAVLDGIRRSVRDGDTNWVMSKTALPHAMNAGAVAAGEGAR